MASEEIVEVKVVAKSRENRVTKMENGSLLVKCTEVPEKGKANQAVIKLLSDYYGVPKSAISIVFGKNLPHKLVKITP